MNVTRVLACGLLSVCLTLIGSAARAAEPSVAELVGGLKAVDEAARLQAIDQLGALGPQAAEAVAPLTQLLKDDSPSVRAHAVHSLGQIGAPAKAAVPAMAELLKDGDVGVRRQVLKAIRAIRPGPQVMIPLCVKLLEDPDPAIRVRVLSAIAEGGAESVPGLIEALKNEKAAYWACIVLRDIGPDAKAAVPALIDKLKDPRPEVRREVILTLGAIQEAAAPAVPYLAASVSDETTRTAATFALGQIGQLPTGAEPTVLANSKSPDHMLSTVSIWAYARAHATDKAVTGHALGHLISRLKDENQMVRELAARALLTLPPMPEVTGPALERELANADETTARHALDALATLGAPAVPRLVAALKHEKLRLEVVYVLGHLGPAAAPATGELAKLLSDKSHELTHATAVALSRIGPGAKEAVPALIAALGHEDGNSNTVSYAYALGRIGPDAAAAQPALAKLLKNDDANVALVGAWALIQIDPASPEVATQTLPALTAGLNSPYSFSRQSAAESLATLGPRAKSAEAALQKASQDDDKGVRDAALQALAAVRNGAKK